MTSTNLHDFIASQEQLLAEAAESLPHAFSQCTYPLGSLRQSVHLCVTCGCERGICDACSIACHADHEQIQLFAKRNFRCDCPTCSITQACTLHTSPEPANIENKYGPNYRGLFCRCLRTYDAETERETMVQCLGCEDWFHESCLNLRERPEDIEEEKPEEGVEAALTAITSEPTLVTSEALPVASQGGAAALESTEDVDDGASEASSSGLPPPLIRGESYDSFVCGSCVSRIPTLKRYAGTPGTLMAVRENVDGPWTVLNASSSSLEEITVVNEPTLQNSTSDAAVGDKRPLSPSAQGPTKRLKPTCSAPPVNPIAQWMFGTEEGRLLGAGDVFLKEDWRERWCRCDECLLSLEANPWLLEEEETYETPGDPDCGLSLEELGMRALERIPRGRAIDGITAFNAMRDDLFKHLRMFAQEGKIVEVDDVNAFFDKLKEAKSG